MKEISVANTELFYAEERQIYAPAPKRKMTTFKELSAMPKSQSLHAMKTVYQFDAVDMETY